jgi:hypothetical protein
MIPDAPPEQPGPPGTVRKDTFLVWRCAQAAQDVLAQRIAEEKADVVAENDRLYALEVTRLERIRAFKRARAEEKLRAALDWLRRHSAAPDAGERLIVPIDKHNVEQAQQALVALEQEYTAALADLAAGRRVVHSVRIRAVALVRGPAAEGGDLKP